MKIYINPGHGTPDPGAVNPVTGLQEKDVCFAVGNLAADYLRAAGYEVIVDQSDHLTGVINRANASGADLFVSIHCNSFGDPRANGTETIYYPGSAQGKKLAECIQKQLIGEFGLTDRGIKQMSNTLGVLTQTAMTAVLAELAFISNATEEHLLAMEQDRWAKAIARGISDYFA